RDRRQYSRFLDVSVSVRLRRMREGDGRATREKEPGAVELVLRRGVRGPYNRPGSGTAAPGASHFRGTAVALADIAQLCGELSVHCHRLDQSPPPHALCRRGYAEPHLVQFRAPVFRVAASAFYGLDGRESVGATACRLLRRSLLSRERDLYRPDLGAHRASPRQRGLVEGAQDHARPIDSHLMRFRDCGGRSVEVSAGRARNVYLLPDCLSEA